MGMEEATDFCPLESETEENEMWQKQLQIKLSFKLAYEISGISPWLY